MKFLCFFAFLFFWACSDSSDSVSFTPAINEDEVFISSCALEIPEESSSATLDEIEEPVPEISSSSFAIAEHLSSAIPNNIGDEPESSSEMLPKNSSSSEEFAEKSSSSSYIFNDEFDMLDEEKWTFEIGNGTEGWGNWEREFYRKENTYIKDGILHIQAKKESFENFDYTSSRLITKGKFEFTYGTIEARIALPVGKGIWPAFWMLGANIDEVGWPK